MPSFIPSWDVIENWLTNTSIGIIFLQLLAAIIFFSFIAAGKTFQVFFKDRRTNRLEVLETRRAYRLAVLKSRLDYFKKMKNRPGRQLAKLNVYGFVFLAFLVMRVSSLYFNLSFSGAFLVSFIMFYAFLVFAITGLLLMNPDYCVKRLERKIAKLETIAKLEESATNSDD